MRRNVSIFMSIILFFLLIVPAVNVLTVSNYDDIKWKQRSFLFNMDFAARWVAIFLYPFGISTDPAKVIIGEEGWLFLGDFYDETISVDRRTATQADIMLGKEIGVAARAWDIYLASEGVKMFRVMIGPNKHSIYPEYMPAWARPVPSNATDALLAATGDRLYIDLRPPLLAAKSAQLEPLYYKTDTHWNLLGSSVAFRAFARQVKKSAPELKWPAESAYELIKVVPRSGGDLSWFLRLSTSLSDSDPVINFSGFPIKTTQYDFDSNQMIGQDENPHISAPDSPLLVKSVGALNNRKVLWLRDSFGTGMSSLMAATFSETLQLHWVHAINPGGRFLELVEKWKPDYVFFTVVERGARNTVFATLPPPILVPDNGTFRPVRATTTLDTNHLKRGVIASEYKVQGGDPSVTFALSSLLAPSEAQYLRVDLTCSNGSSSVPLQLFWMEDETSVFDEEHSARFSFRTGQSLIDLRTLPKWNPATAISRIRLNIEGNNTCAHFKLENPAFGQNGGRP